MTRLWLPTGRKPFFNPKDEREHLINRLWELRYSVPGAKGMEVQQLKDYVQFAEERFTEDKVTEQKEKEEAEKKLSKMAPDQVKGAMKEYLNWKYRKEGKEHRYAIN